MGMERRQTLKLVGTVGATASVAGCGRLLGGCGPGEDKIGDLERWLSDEPEPENPDWTPVTEANITGELESVQWAGGVQYVLDDGTGRARLVSPPDNEFEPGTLEVGDCVEATGTPYPQDGPDWDFAVEVEESGPANE